MNRLSQLNPFRSSHEKASTPSEGSGQYDEIPIPRLTIHSFIMGVFVSMGGFIFGYDTGQISGFLYVWLL